MSEHSRSPWTIANEGAATPGPVVVKSAVGLYVASVVTVSDARLIAAAPDLLAVVGKLYAAVIGHTGEVDDCDLCQLQGIAQAALEKVRTGRGTE